jgi:cysteine desulfurase/selenocysteine lyase
MIYFDQAASSFPKPEKVARAAYEAISEYAANPGRGSHFLAKRASDIIYQTRLRLSKLFGLQDPKRVLFFQNATGALNQAIKGLPLKKGDHVITTSYEHNSVRRPLEQLRGLIGIEITYLQPDHNGEIESSTIYNAISEKTKLIVVTHGSNLTGMIVPIEKLGKIAKEKKIIFMVDASQTAGILPINMGDVGIDLLAFAGHKGLLGPQGTGALLVRPGIEMEPLLVGGTGSHSESAEQPNTWPERFESGTLNTPGIAGLHAGLEEVERLSVSNIFEHEKKLTSICIEKLMQLSGIKVFGPDPGVKRLAVIPFILEGIESHEVAMVLDQHYNIAVRAGMHCTPLGHASIGTSDTGVIRVSFGPYNTEEEVLTFARAIEEIKVGFLG